MLSWKRFRQEITAAEPWNESATTASTFQATIREAADDGRSAETNVRPTIVLAGLCRGGLLTDTGKRLQLLKILTLTLLPILGLWAFTVFSLSDSIQGKFDIEQTQYAVKFSVEIGMFLDRIQRERDMSVLYLSILGPETKTFLMNEYLLTDQALEQLSDWPVKNDIQPMFQSKKDFHQFLQEHRNNLDPSNYDIYVEMDFYSFLIERFIEWMYGAIRESNMASIWKILVAYQKIVTVMEHIGIERALGTVFFVEGGFPTQSVYERYNNRVNIFKANYRSAVLYSKMVDPIFQQGVTATGTNLTAVIEDFRFETQHAMVTSSSVTKGQWWFDNMTLYLDTLLMIQRELAYLINGQLEDIIQAEEKNLTISACFLVIVFLMCPLVIYSVEALTSDIQKYAIALVAKTKELGMEKKKMDELLYQMVPRPVANAMKVNNSVEAEYFKSVTIMFSDIYGFTQLTMCIPPMEIVQILNTLYTAIDEKLDNHEVYKVETINDSYMVASGIGLPTRLGNRHSAEVANLALDLRNMMSEPRFSDMKEKNVQLRIGMNTGPCMAGIVGVMMPRYCLFGDTVNTASRMKSYSLPNKIHISTSCYNSLRKHGIYVVCHRGNIQVKGKGSMMTYWLLSNSGQESAGSTKTSNATSLDSVTEADKDMPGEVDKISHSSLMGKFCMFGMSNTRWESLEAQLGYQDPSALAETSGFNLGMDDLSSATRCPPTGQEGGMPTIRETGEKHASVGEERSADNNAPGTDSGGGDGGCSSGGVWGKEKEAGERSVP